MDEKIKTIEYQSLHKVGDFLSDDQAMNLAIQMAYKGAAFVSPNPLVGCVVLDKNDQLLSYGFHEKYGEGHAEVQALRNLSQNQLLQAKIFVTLEPCSHYGKTPPCAKKLAEFKLKKVIYGLKDPNPLVSGAGAKILSEAGIDCSEYQGPFKSDLKDLAEIFLKNFTQNKIFVAAKWAQSLDGQIGLKSGESQWITNELSRKYSHELRSWYDAILVGRKTIEIDNPSLNIRHPLIQKSNTIIILDPKALLINKINSGQSYKFLEVHHLDKIIFAVNKDHDLKFDSDFKVIKFDQLSDLLQSLYELKIKSVFIEGGPITISSFVQASLVDRVHVFTAPVLIGSEFGQSSLPQLVTSKMTEKRLIQNIKLNLFGSDIYLTGRLEV